MKDDCIYLLHIRDAIEHIMEYTIAGKGSFLADRKTQDAVVRNLEIIGERDQAPVSLTQGCSSRHLLEAHRRHER